MWKIIIECRPIGGQQGSIGTLTQLPRNARRDFFFFSNTCQKMRGGKHCKSQGTAGSGYSAFSR